MRSDLLTRKELSGGFRATLHHSLTVPTMIRALAILATSAALALAPVAPASATVDSTATSPALTASPYPWVRSTLETTVTVAAPATVTVRFTADPRFRVSDRVIVTTVPAGTTTVTVPVSATRYPNRVTVSINGAVATSRADVHYR